jgi:uncharacterized GH25 family protein
MKGVKKLYTILPDETIRLTAEHKPGDHFLLLAVADNGKNVPAAHLTLTKNRELVDSHGTIYAAEDETLMVDTTSRTGVGFFSLDKGHWSEAATDIHDFQTSCTTYQESYSRSEAEDTLARNLEAVATTSVQKVVGKVLSKVSRIFSWAFWDSSKTRWK